MPAALDRLGASSTSEPGRGTTRPGHRELGFESNDASGMEIEKGETGRLLRHGTFFLGSGMSPPTRQTMPWVVFSPAHSGEKLSGAPHHALP